MAFISMVRLRERQAAQSEAALQAKSRHTLAAFGRPEPVVGPPATVEEGATSQGPFDLLAVTRCTGAASRTPPELSVGRVPLVSDFVQNRIVGTGLWISVIGGIGIQTRIVPPTPTHQVYPYGPGVTLVVDILPTPTVPRPRPTFLQRMAHLLLGRPLPIILPPSRSYSVGWAGPGGVGRLSDDRQPFQILTGAGPNGAGDIRLTLVPRGLYHRFPVSAQPLSAAGTPFGAPATLFCRPAGRHTLFVPLPAAYNSATRKMDISMTDLSAPGGRARWRLTNLPPALHNGPDARQPVTSVSFGSLSIRGAATMAEDLCGDGGWLERHPERRVGGWSINPPQNLDNHPWTGLPTVRYGLQISLSPTVTGRPDWTVLTQRVTTAWSVPPIASMNNISSPESEARPLHVDWVSPYQAGKGITTDQEAGAGFPGQQPWIEIEGVAVRTGATTERLVFHGATVRLDPATGRSTVVWDRPQTLTTPSGVSVTVLNARPGRTPPHGFGASLLPTGAAEVFLAWRPPASVVSQRRGGLSAARRVLPPTPDAPLLGQTYYNTAPPDWGDVWLPGVPPPPPRVPGHRPIGPPPPSPFRPYIHAGYEPLRLVIMPPGAPPGAPSGGAWVGRLDDIPFRVTTRSDAERHPFTLVLPVRDAFPPGWDVDAADGRYRSFP